MALAEGEADVTCGGNPIVGSVLAASLALEVNVRTLSGYLLSTQHLPLESTLETLRLALIEQGMVCACTAQFLLHDNVAHDGAKLVEASESGTCEVQIINQPALPAPGSGGVIRSVADLLVINPELSENLGYTSDDDDDDVAFAIVMDCGSFEMKAGFSGDDNPREVLPTVVGTPLYGKDVYVGDDAIRRRGILMLKWPVQYGLPVDFESMERVWHHTFYNELRVAPEEHPVLLTECLLNPRAIRERMVQTMFEQFQVRALYVVPQAVMTLYFTLNTTGLVLDCGHDHCCVLPISDGFAHAHAAFKLEYGGKALTNYLVKLLKESGSADDFTTSAECEIARDIKETLCFVAEDFQAQATSYEERDRMNYERPDGTILQVGLERFHCPEALFNPRLLGNENAGLHELVFKSGMACDISMRTNMFSNITLSGGSSMFPGMAERMTKELRALVPANMDVMVVALPRRRHAAWIGGSMLASQNSFQKHWVTRQKFEDLGPRAVQIRCP